MAGLETGPLVLGTNVFGWTVREDAAFALLDHARARGITCLDTADHYVSWAPGGQGGESETIIGRWLAARGHPEEVAIVTKVGFPMGDGSAGLSREHVRRSLAGSLARLQRTRVDLYMAHLEDPDTPIEETMDTFAELVAAGQVGELGVSQLDPRTIERGMDHAARHGLPGFTTYETLYNLYDREPFEGEGAAMAARFGFKVLPFRSLAAGFLTGKYRKADDLTGARGPRAAACFTPRGFGILDALDAVAGETGTSPGAVALAWLRARPHVGALLVGATSPAQIDEQLVGARLVLDERQTEQLDRASAMEAA